jgi:hypothetical protein
MHISNKHLKYGSQMKKISIIFLAIFAIGVGQLAQAQTVDSNKRAFAYQLAPIKSLNDLNSYLAVTPSKKSPLNVLPASEKKKFLESLTFNENGLTGFNFQILKSNLNTSQTNKILALFGAQHLASVIHGNQPDAFRGSSLNSAHANPKNRISPKFFGDDESIADHIGYYCSGRSTCNSSASQICMSSC